MRPDICRTNQRVYIPSDDIACEEKEIFVERVSDISEVTPEEGHEYFDDDGYLWGFLNGQFVKLNARPVHWGDLEGTLVDQTDLKLALEACVKTVNYNGTALTGETVSLESLVRVKVNGTELEQTDHEVNIDLTPYALAENVPGNLSEINNDVGFVTSEQVNSLIIEASSGTGVDLSKYALKTDLSKYALASDIPGIATDEEIDGIFTEE